MLPRELQEYLRKYIFTRSEATNTSSKVLVTHLVWFKMYDLKKTLFSKIGLKRAAATFFESILCSLFLCNFVKLNKM
jgi:hypothetical protein